MKFVDLFAGLGGFHLGLANSGEYECVFACESNPRLRKLYKSNFGLEVNGDIRTVDENTVPTHDVMCAGFPCQPFSLAGLKKGVACSQFGNLIEDVLRLAKHRNPEFLILENVPGILTIENGEFWKYIAKSFENLGYRLKYKIISPEDIGIPQNRKRLFIVGSLNHDLSKIFEWSGTDQKMSLNDIYDNTRVHRFVEYEKHQQLLSWQRLLSNCSLPASMPCLTISAQEFGATYPLNFSKFELSDMKMYRGSYGTELESSVTWEAMLKRMPNYCRKEYRVPNWMEKSVMFSRNIYENNKEYLDEWCVKFNRTYNSWQLLEWRGDNTVRNLKSHIIQFRASGIRILKANKMPSLVSMTKTQVPIIGLEMRYLSKYEAAMLQNLQTLPKIPGNDSAAFAAIGNAVNAKIVELIGSNIKKLKFSSRSGGTNDE